MTSKNTWSNVTSGHWKVLRRTERTFDELEKEHFCAMIGHSNTTRARIVPFNWTDPQRGSHWRRWFMTGYEFHALTAEYECSSTCKELCSEVSTRLSGTAIKLSYYHMLIPGAVCYSSPRPFDSKPLSAPIQRTNPDPRNATLYLNEATVKLLTPFYSPSFSPVQNRINPSAPIGSCSR